MPRKVAANAKAAKEPQAVPVTLTLVPPSADTPTLADVEARQTPEPTPEPAPEMGAPQYSRGVEEAIQAVAAEVDRYARDELPVNMLYLHAEGYRRILAQYIAAGVLDQDEVMMRHLYAQRAILQEQHAEMVVKRDVERLSATARSAATSSALYTPPPPRLVRAAPVAKGSSGSPCARSDAGGPLLLPSGRPSARARR